METKSFLLALALAFALGIAATGYATEDNHHRRPPAGACPWEMGNLSQRSGAKKYPELTRLLKAKVIAEYVATVQKNDAAFGRPAALTGVNFY